MPQPKGTSCHLIPDRVGQDVRGVELLPFELTSRGPPYLPTLDRR